MSARLERLPREERLRPWGPRIHVASGTTTFLRIPIRNNTAVLELERGLLVWNPIALTDPLRASLDALAQQTGRRVAVLLAALDYHHRYLLDWQRAYPDAETLLVSDRIRAHQPDARGQPLEGLADPDLALLDVRGCLQPVTERGPRREVLVLHRPSRSLLVGDLLTVHERVSWTERLVGFRPGFTRNAVGFRIGDRAAWDGFARELLAWDADQVLTVHGRSTAHGADGIRRDLAEVLRA